MRKIIGGIRKKKVMSLQPIISDTPFDQKSSINSGRGCFEFSHTDRQTYGHRDSMTETAQLADSVKDSFIFLQETLHQH